MKNITKLIVHLQLGDKDREVGELVNTNRKIYFSYYPEFVATQLQISPFKFPLSNDILSSDAPFFEGLFGVFSDSLPDGWGRLLLDRALMAKGISLDGITPLDRLSFIGKNGSGALYYEPVTETGLDENIPLELDHIALATKKVLAGSSTDIIEELFHLGGSSGGARPKIFVGYNEKTDHIIHGQAHLPKGYEHWIIKFSAATDPKDMAAIEYAYHKMAVAAGLEMSACRLFKSSAGNAYFGTKRFDRIGNKRLHLHSAAGLMHDNFRLSNMDYGHVMDAAFRLENHVKAYEKVLRLAAFNIFAHNKDDHSKNISFLMDATGKWRLAPAYDLTFSFSGHGYHSMTVAGEWASPSTKQLMELANTFGVKNGSVIIAEVKAAISHWKSFAMESGVTKLAIERIHRVIGKN